MEVDDDLSRFEADGALPLPLTEDEGYVECEGAWIWYATYGVGTPVILLHGGLGHSGNWGYQVPALVASGHCAVVIDSRGHGRSTRDARPYTYELMAAGSDGACIALVLAAQNSSRVAGVFFFACNMDPSGAKAIEPSPILERCFGRHAKDYAQLSTTPDGFKDFVGAVSLMQRTEPNYSASDLAAIRVPVVIAQSERDEFIKREQPLCTAAAAGVVQCSGAGVCWWIEGLTRTFTDDTD
jgi:pimeloyl-ACP methyl ester carboxylesterase